MGKRKRRRPIGTQPETIAILDPVVNMNVLVFRNLEDRLISVCGQFGIIQKKEGFSAGHIPTRQVLEWKAPLDKALWACIRFSDEEYDGWKILAAEEVETVERFNDEYRFLSNFWKCRVPFEGIDYPSVEHAYQASKTLDVKIRRQICYCANPGDAKRMGRRIQMRSDIQLSSSGDKVRIQIMWSLIKAKFQNPGLAKRLRATHPKKLIEGNYWNDTFWGVDLRTRTGHNYLGRLLMRAREAIL